MSSLENTNWLFDYGLIDGNNVPTGDFTSPSTGFHWPSQGLNVSSDIRFSNDCLSAASVEIGGHIEDSDGLKKVGSRKRCVRPESCNGSDSKAWREKKRRDMLNDRFLELASILEPEKPPKMDKAAILTDAVRMVTQLRSEAQKIKESNESLQEKIKELKAEKNELRDEKQRLKAEKDQLEKQVNAMSMQPSFVPQPSAIPTALAAQSQAAGNKMMPFVGYPGVAMWQFLPPTFVDTSKDHVRHPPVA